MRDEREGKKRRNRQREKMRERTNRGEEGGMRLEGGTVGEAKEERE